MAAANNAKLHHKTDQTDEITAHAGMSNKGWTFSGDPSSDIRIGIGVGDNKDQKVLGLPWDPKIDIFKFQTKLKVNLNAGVGLVDVFISLEEELDDDMQEIVLTRKLVLSYAMKVFDPIGLLSPLLLQTKLLLRETWNIEGLCWDDPLPEKI